MVKTSSKFMALAVLLLGAAAARAEGTPVLELRGEATIQGETVRLRQVARWTTNDAGFFRELGDLQVARFVPEQRDMTLTLDNIRTMLEGAGVNVADVSIRGPVTLKVHRLDADAAYAKKPKEEAPKNLEEFMAQPAATQPTVMKANDPAWDSILPSNSPTAPNGNGTTLRQALASYLSERISIPAEDIELTFPATQDRVLNLTDPAYHWRITTFRSAKLGSVSFRVTLSNGTSTRQIQLDGVARAWQEQLRVSRPVAVGQTLREDDLELKRMLVDNLPTDMPIRREFALTMQATRDMNPGQLVTMSMLKPVLLVRRGQIVTVVANMGGIELKSVGTAKDDGVYGGAITVMMGEGKTGREVKVTVSGPQEARAGVAEPVASK